MAEHVVDLFEIIEIEIENAAILIGTAGAPGERAAYTVLEQCAIGQTRKHVMQGIVLQFGFHLLGSPMSR